MKVRPEKCHTKGRKDEIDFFFLFSQRPLTVVKSISALFMIVDDVTIMPFLIHALTTRPRGDEESFIRFCFKKSKLLKAQNKITGVLDQFECKCVTINNIMLSLLSVPLNLGPNYTLLRGVLRFTFPLNI